MKERVSREVWEGSFNSAISRLGEKLSAAGYARRNSADYIRVVKHFCYWHARRAAPGLVDESRMGEFLRHLPSCACPVPGKGPYRLCHAAVSHFLAVLREMGLAPEIQKASLPEDAVLQTFHEHLTKTRGAAETSASLYARHLRPFLQSICNGGEFAFSSITPRDVETAVMHRAGLYKAKTVKLYCTSLRAFFRFLKLRGEIELPLEDAVPAVAHWSLSSLPKYLEEGRFFPFFLRRERPCRPP